MSFKTCCFLALAVSLAISAATAHADLDRESLLRVLRENGISVDEAQLQEAVVAAILKSVDPGAVVTTSAVPPVVAVEDPIESEEEWAEDLRYLKLKGLYAGSADLVLDRLRRWAESGESGIIMDLRGASGHSLEDVDRIASVFAQQGDILYHENDGRGDRIETHRAPFVAESSRIKRPPVTLLVDEGTRGASEAFAAVVAGRPGIMLLGAHTSGDAGVRSMLALTNAVNLYISTRWVKPHRRPDYHGAGVTPDIVISNTATATATATATWVPEKSDMPRRASAKALEDRELMSRVGSDPVLRRATDILLGLGALRESAGASGEDGDVPLESREASAPGNGDPEPGTNAP